MICKGCNTELELIYFPIRNDRSGKPRPYCLKCSRNIAKARYIYYRQTNPFKHKVTRARTRAKTLGLSFDLDPEYLESIWTGYCPVLNKPISLLDQRENEYAAELDRFVPEKGYVKGNVHFLSRRANRLKNNVTTKELKQLLIWMQQYEDN